MSFSSTVKGHEVSYITRLLEVFGVVEQRQMRSLFSHLSDEAYGKILSRLNKEGQIFWAKDGVRLAASRLTMDRASYQNSVMCFWVFIELKKKKKITDFCTGDPPAIVTITTKTSVVDIIPVSADTIEEIDRNMEGIPEQTKRFLVTKDLQLLSGVARRFKNDYVLLVDDSGNVKTYEL